MPFPLPPPDPFEQATITPPNEVCIPAPTAVFLGGAPSPAVDRLSDAILAARPGALFVVVRD